MKTAMFVTLALAPAASARKLLQMTPGQAANLAALQQQAATAQAQEQQASLQLANAQAQAAQASEQLAGQQNQLDDVNTCVHAWRRRQRACAHTRDPRAVPGLS